MSTIAVRPSPRSHATADQTPAVTPRRTRSSDADDVSVARLRPSEVPADLGRIATKLGVDTARTRVSVVPSDGDGWGRAAPSEVHLGLTRRAARDRSLVAHELAHVAQFENRRLGVAPDVTRAESEAAGLAHAARTDRALWLPRAALPDGHIAADDDASGIDPDMAAPDAGTAEAGAVAGDDSASAPAAEVTTPDAGAADAGSATLPATAPSATGPPGTLADPGFASAVADHARDVQTFVTLVQTGQKSADAMTRNSCELVAKQRVKAYALTPTADRFQRVVAAGSGGSIAYFSYPGGAIYETPVSYNASDISDNTNVLILPANQGGFQENGAIALTQSSLLGPRNEAFAALRHEVQHVVDDHGLQTGGSSAATALARYKSEFRAYWLGSRFAASESETDAAQNVTAPFDEYKSWTARQWAIFVYVYRYYPYVQEAWNAERDTFIFDRTFQRGVVAFQRPDSTDPRNSIRVADFDAALRAVTKEACDDSQDPRVVQVKRAHDRLNADDRAAVKASSELQLLIEAKTSGNLRSALADVVKPSR